MKTTLPISKVHFSPFKVFSSSLANSLCKLWSCSTTVFPWTSKSSAMFTTPSMSAMTWLMMCWYFSGAALTPKLSLLLRNKPSCVTKVVMSLESACSSTRWKPWGRSSFEKTVLPFSSSSTSSIVSIGSWWRSHLHDACPHKVLSHHRRPKLTFREKEELIILLFK